MKEADINTLFGQAAASHQAGRLQQAAVAYRKVLKIHPDHADALHLLGMIENSNGNHETSVRLISRAVALMDAAASVNPNHVNAINNLGNALRDQGDAQGAIAAYQRVLKLEPRNHVGRNNLGNALKDLGRLQEAVRCYEQALAIQPDYGDACANLGNARREQGRLEEAVQCYRRVLSIHPRHAGAHSNLAAVLLARGEFTQGWQEYEWRWEGNRWPQRPFPCPVWEGAELRGKTILVYAEQGIGDEIMFASCIPDLVERAGQVVLECEPRLLPLFSRSFPAVTVHGNRRRADLSWLSGVAAIDVNIAVGSLPLHLRSTLESFPDNPGYLLPDAHKLENWRQRYAGLGDGMKVGLSWRGGRMIIDSKQRSIGLDQWGSILQHPGIQFINLQYGDSTAEIARVQEQSGIRIHDWDEADPLRDMDDFAAQIAALDLVISVDNSTVHLAGSLGVPAWILQPFSGDWRWLAGHEDSYWYPGIRQFWQPQAGAWEPVVAAVARQLTKFPGK